MRPAPSASTASGRSRTASCRDSLHPVDKTTGVVTPVDFAVYIDTSGRQLERMMTPMIVFENLKQWCKPKK